MITTAPELIYMLKVNIGIALFYAFYKLFCCRDTFFQWRRIALLSFLALSFLYPLMDMQAWVKEQPAINELADYYALMMLTETNTSILFRHRTCNKSRITLGYQKYICKSNRYPLIINDLTLQILRHSL